MEIDIKSMKILIILFTVVTVLTGCFFGTAVEKTVTPTIRAITDLFAVTDIGSATLVVSGSEMETQTITLSATEMSTDFIVTIPEGVITFDLTVEMGVLYTGAVASYFGTTTETISTDNTNVIITLGVERTKIVVPDYLNSKITQFDDISGSNALSLSSAAIVSLLFTAGYTLSTFSPHNIDFDNEGRIYIANYAGSTESGFIRIDNIAGLNPIYKNRDSVSGIIALTVDRVNNLIYYTDGSTVYRNNLDGTDEIIQIASDEGLFDIKGLSLDNNGNIYIAHNPDGGQILKYSLNPSVFVSGKIAGDLGLSWLNTWDIMVKGTSLFITNPGGDVGEQIIELSTTDLSLIGNYGNTTTTVDTSLGMFYGPRRFSAQMNDEITIIDDYDAGGMGPNFDKIIQMNNISGNGWITLPTTGAADESGQSLFLFFTLNPPPA